MQSPGATGKGEQHSRADEDHGKAPSPQGQSYQRTSEFRLRKVFPFCAISVFKYRSLILLGSLGFPAGPVWAHRIYFIARLN